MRIKKFNQMNEELYNDIFLDDEKDNNYDGIFSGRYKNDNNENENQDITKISYNKFLNDLKIFIKKYEKDLDLYDIKKGLFEVFKKY